MINFKEIAEKCLAGELSGRFVCRDGLQISSFTLSRTDNPSYPYKLYRVGKLTIDGHTPNKYSQNDIIQFIPYEEMKPEQIKIDIPEGKVPVMEQTESGVVISWKEKKLTYDDVVIEQAKAKTHITIFSYNMLATNPEIHSFYKKVEVLRKLINIRNYFGKPDSNENGFYINLLGQAVPNGFPAKYASDIVVFAKKEHAEQAIKILGDELKYLFEPW
jgi:hypothetical protein